MEEERGEWRVPRQRLEYARAAVSGSNGVLKEAAGIPREVGYFDEGTSQQDVLHKSFLLIRRHASRHSRQHHKFFKFEARYWDLLKFVLSGYLLHGRVTPVYTILPHRPRTVEECVRVFYPLSESVEVVLGASLVVCRWERR